MKLLIDENSKKYLIREEKEFHTGLGIIKEEDIKQPAPAKIKSHTGKDFLLVDANPYDLFEKMKRGPQIITLKDAGYILARTGITKDSVVLDAGGGSGGLTCFLALHAKKVITYENRKEFFDIVQKNIELFGLKNVELKDNNIYETKEKSKVDVITLDLKEPWRVNTECLKLGGCLAVYVPTVNQIAELKFEGFVLEEITELIKRDWRTDEILRPKSKMIAHTGFIAFLRKIN